VLSVAAWSWPSVAACACKIRVTALHYQLLTTQCTDSPSLTEVNLRQCEVPQALQLLELLPQHSVTHAAGQRNLLQSCMQMHTHNCNRACDACNTSAARQRSDENAQHQ
jgi:hypothetical protein